MCQIENMVVNFKHMKKTFVLFFILCFSLIIKSEENKIVILNLDKALQVSGKSCGLELSIPVKNNTWSKNILGYAVFYSEFGQYSENPRSFNKNDHWGIISEINTNSDEVNIDVNMFITDDPWIKGGRGNYNISISISGDSCTGTFYGTFQDSINVSGNVNGIIINNPVITIPDFNSIAPGEHPRLIYRKDELDKIRNIAQNTPEGLSIVDQLETTLNQPFDYMTRNCAWMAAGHGLMYSLTNDKFWSDSTRSIVTNIMNSTTDNSKMIRRSPRYMGVAIAYDFCYDAWEEDYPEYREKVANWLEKRILEIVKGGGIGYNSHPMSNWMGIAYGNIGTIAMAILDDSARFVYEEPHRPFNGQIFSENITEGSGITVVELLNDSLSDYWVFSGPIRKVDDNDDLLESIGGSPNANPQEGTNFTYEGQNHEFVKLDSNGFWNGGNYTNNKKYIDVVNNINHKYYQSAVYYTILENETERKVRLDMNLFYPEDIKGKIWLNGTEIRDGDYIQLNPGKYRLLAEVTIDVCEPWGHIAFRPVFIDVDQSEIDEIYPLLMTDYDSEHQIWEERHNRYLNNGRKAASANYHIELAEAGMKRWLKMGMGSNGFYTEGEGYLRFATTCGVGQFVHAYRKVMGKDIAKYYGFNHVLTKQLSETVNKKMWAWGPAGWSDFNMQEERSGCFNMLLSSCEDNQLPAIKYLYDQVYGLSGNNTFNIQMPYQAAYALENYPFNIDADAATPSREVKKFMIDEQKAYILSRKSFNFNDDFITTFYLKSEYKTATHQANNYPEIRIQGLSKQIGQIYHVKVDETINEQLGGKIITINKNNDGSFIMNADMDAVYLEKYEKTIHSYPSQGINAHRSFAVDYSETSGSPALYAIVDRISGASSETWQMEMTNATGGNVSGQDFQIDYSGFSVYGKVLSPVGANVNYADNLITITGGSDFYVVFCVSASSTPSFSVSGSGMNSAVILGSQTVSYNFTDSILMLSVFNNTPVIEINKPLANSEHTSGDSILVDASITDTDGFISLVKYQINDSIVFSTIDSAEKPKFSFDSPGLYKLNIIAFDDNSDSTISESRFFYIVNTVQTGLNYNLTASEYLNEFILLNWDDAANNEDGYVIERKSGSSDFNEIARTAKNSVSFIDISAAKETSYSYRIVPFNRTEKFNYSNEVDYMINETSIFPELATIVGKTYPNPFTDKINIEVSLSSSEDIIVQIISISGKIIYNKLFSDITEGVNKIALENMKEFNGIGLLILIQNNKIIYQNKIVHK